MAIISHFSIASDTSKNSFCHIHFLLEFVTAFRAKIDFKNQMVSALHDVD